MTSNGYWPLNRLQTDANIHLGCLLVLISRPFQSKTLNANSRAFIFFLSKKKMEFNEFRFSKHSFEQQ